MPFPKKQLFLQSHSENLNTKILCRNLNLEVEAVGKTVDMYYVRHTRSRVGGGKPLNN